MNAVQPNIASSAYHVFMSPVQEATRNDITGRFG